MHKIPSAATKEEIEKIVAGLNSPTQPVNTTYAAMAYLSMCRHPYMSVEWLIAQFVWDESIKKISDCVAQDTANTVKSRIEQLYQEKGYFPNTK